MAQWNLTPAFMNVMYPQGDMYGLPPQLRGVMPTPMEQVMNGINPPAMPGQWAVGAQPVQGIGGRGQGPAQPPQGGWQTAGGPGMPGYSLRGAGGGGMLPAPKPSAWGGNSLVGRTTNSGYVLPSLQDLLGKYAGWASMPGTGNRGQGTAQPGGPGMPGYSLRGPNGGTNLYDAPPIPGGMGATPPGMGAPGYDLRGGHGAGQWAGGGAQPVQGIGGRGQGPTQPPQGGGIPGGPGYSLGGPNGKRFLYDTPPVQGGNGWTPKGEMDGIMAQQDPGDKGGGATPPYGNYPPGYPGIGTIPGTGPLPPPTGVLPGSGTVGTTPSPVVPAPTLGPVNPNAPKTGGGTWGPGYGNSGWPGGWTPPSTGTTPKSPTATPTPTPTPAQGGGGGGSSGGWTAQPAPSGGPSTGSGQPGDNGFGPAPNAQQLAYLQYLWEQQQWQDKLGQDAASLQWQKDQFGQNMDWQKQQWGGQFGLQQDQFGLNVLKNQQDYGLAQDQFGLNVLKNQQDYGLAQTGMGLNQDQFGLNVLDWQAKQGQQQWANQFNQDQFDWSKGTNTRDFNAQQAQQGWANTFNQNQFDWSKQMDTTRNDIAKQNASFAAFGRRFAPNVAVM